VIRLTWRQFRTPAIVVLAALAVLAVFAAVTGVNLAHAYATTLEGCRKAGNCSEAMASFQKTDLVLRNAFGTLIVLVPALIGAFWGAPMIAREVEAGTFPLVWTQSITRGRWLAVKLTVLGLASMATAGLLSLIITWWARPLDHAGADVYGSFAQRDIAPIGYAALAFMIGVTAGLLIRRTLPAMAVTLGAFLLVRIGGTFWFRPRVIGPKHLTMALDPNSTGYGSMESPTIMLNSLFNGSPASSLEPATPNLPNAWIYSTRVVDGSGKDLTNTVLKADCPGIGGGGGGGGAAVNGHVEAPQSAQDQMRNCVATVNKTYHELVTYQPPSRYWELQWCEFALYGVLALVLAAFCFWWVRRRRIA
jgi:ABC-type transport system involved in multi-copper enzyme maturation permease subunit